MPSRDGFIADADNARVGADQHEVVGHGGRRRGEKPVCLANYVRGGKSLPAHTHFLSYPLRCLTLLLSTAYSEQFPCASRMYNQFTIPVKPFAFWGHPAVPMAQEGIFFTFVACHVISTFHNSSNAILQIILLAGPRIPVYGH